MIDKIVVPFFDDSKPHHVSLDAVYEFLSVVVDDEHTEKFAFNPWLDGRYARALWRKDFLGLSQLITSVKTGCVFAIAMGVNAEPASLRYRMSKNKILYLFDAWPTKYDSIVSFVHRTKTSLLFVSAKQSAERLSHLLPDCRVIWCPEACASGVYRAVDYGEKTIDILALGRKNDKLHQALIAAGFESSYNYLYEKVKGEIVFPSRDEFLNGLANSKILICYPRSVTHPELAGDIETMTNRYLQGMASKVLMVGKCPDEMKDLMGYSPVIDLDEVDPVKHLTEILLDYDKYIPLIEKNYIEFCSAHTWKNRWDFIKKEIFNHQL